MRFGVENNLLMVDRVFVEEQQIQIFEGLGEEVGLHSIARFEGFDIHDIHISNTLLAVAHHIVKNDATHLPVSFVLGMVIQIIGRLNELRIFVPCRTRSLFGHIVELLGHHTVDVPRVKTGFLDGFGPLDIARQQQNSTKESVQCAVPCLNSLAGVHVGVTVPVPGVGSVNQVRVNRCV